jgi:hypothetical protein
MTDRPCKAGAEVNWLWQALSPDMPMPGCGTNQNENASAKAAGAEQTIW